MVPVRNLVLLPGIETPFFCGRVIKPERIVHLRKIYDISQSALAKLLNVSPSTVRRWEAGKSKPSGSAIKLLTLAEKKGLFSIS